MAKALVSSDRTMSHAITRSTAPPHTEPVHDRDHRCGKALYGSKQHLERLVVGDWIHVRKRQLVDVVTGRRDRLAVVERITTVPLGSELFEVVEYLAHQVGAERVGSA